MRRRRFRGSGGLSVFLNLGRSSLRIDNMFSCTHNADVGVGTILAIIELFGFAQICWKFVHDVRWWQVGWHTNS